MKRSGFLKSLAAIIAAPSLLKDVSLSAPVTESVAPVLASSTSNLFSDLQLLAPHWHKEMVEKYSDKNYRNYVTEIREDWQHPDTNNL